jgi:3-deoxy-D-manno-octulosonic-acid transferase
MLGLERSITARLGLASGQTRGSGIMEQEAGGTVWIHGASVGESLSGLAVARLLSSVDPGLRFVVTSGTTSGVDILSARISADQAAHEAVVGVEQAPLDVPWSIRRFIGAWRPRALVCIESDFWPNMLWECHKKGMPLILVDGRMSPRSAKMWSWQPGRGLISALLSRFSLVLCQSPGDARRLGELGAREATCVGSAKAASGAIPIERGQAEPLAQCLGSRQVWVAASTHPGEEEMVAEAHEGLLSRWRDTAEIKDDGGGGGGGGRGGGGVPAASSQPPLLVIIPRHPHRAEGVSRTIRSRHTSWKVVLLSKSGVGFTDKDATVVVAGHLGATGPWMALSRVCFVGGSMIEGIGGHNVIEPARLGCAVVHGQWTDNADHMIEAMLSQHPMSLRRVSDVSSLEQAVADGMLLEGCGGDHAKAAAERLESKTREELATRVIDSLRHLPRDARGNLL